MTAELKEYIKHIMLEVNSVLNLTDFSYKEQKFDNIGQNYFGIVVPVTAVGKNKGKDVTIELVLKLAPTDQRYRVSGAVTLMFAREIYVYSIILETYETFQENFHQDSQLVIPKCYYICKEYCKEVIVMQNMCGDSYVTITKETLDYDHIRISLQALAKFHALSFVLKEKEPILYEEAEKVCEPLTQKANKRFMEVLVDRLEKAIRNFERTKYLPLLQDFKTNCVKHVEAATFSAQKTCICHGDIWKENILYKYENNKPIAACLIDYQAARICSSAFDALYLITTSTDSNLRRIYYKQLIVIYYEQFAKVLSNAGLEADVNYSRTMFEDDLKIVAPACFIVANTALWLANGLQEEGHVRSRKILNTPEERVVAVNKYKAVIQSIFDDYIQYGYLVDS